VYNNNYQYKPGDVVMHLCDNKRCIEPSHLVLGTTRENNRHNADKGKANNQFTKGRGL
jgi:hypothetical protein